MQVKKLSNKQENEKVKAAVCSLYSMNAKFKRIKDEYEEKKKKLTLEISNYMFVNGVDAFSFLNEAKELSKFGRIQVKKIRQKKIKFDVGMVEKRIDKELANEFIDKKYIVNDIDGLVSYLKSCGVNPKRFKSFIDVEKTVNQKKLDELGGLGEISMNDLAGCYEVVENEGYIKITETEE